MAIPTSNMCPVCGATVKGGICQQCGYAVITFPAAVPDTIKQFEEQRVSVLKQLIERENKLKQQADREMATKQAEIDKLHKEADNLHKEIERLRKEAGLYAAETNSLRSLVERLRADLNKAEGKTMERAKAFVIFQERTDEFTVLPVWEGKVNYYATAPTKSKLLSQQSDVWQIIPATTTVDIAFSIAPDGRGGYKITDLGLTLLLSGLPVQSSKRITNLTKLSFEGTRYVAYFSINE